MSSGALGNLDDPCAVCDRPCGDHTLREWNACMGNFKEIPAQAIDEDAAAIANREITERFGLDPDTIVADNVLSHAGTLDGSTGVVSIKVPILVHEFQSSATGSPTTVAKVVFMAGDADGIRSYGRLTRDLANQAANKVESER